MVARPTSEPAVFNFNWLAATGSGILVAAILAGLLMGLGPTTLAAAFARTVYQYSLYGRHHCRHDGARVYYPLLRAGRNPGTGLCANRRPLPFFGTLIGWLGTASTGSDTSANVLFGSLQTMTAHQIGVSPVLMASANSCGGVMGKMIAAPSIVVASTATQTYGQEGAILRFVFLHSLALATLVGLVVYLMAYVPPFTTLVAH